MPSQPSPVREPRFLDRLAAALHQQRFTPAVNRNYVGWVRRFIFFHRLRHPNELGVPEVAAFLTTVSTFHGRACRDYRSSCRCKSARN